MFKNQRKSNFIADNKFEAGDALVLISHITIDLLGYLRKN